MITENMVLTTKRDAVIWAGQSELNDEQSARLSDWIWKNKPHLGCTYAEHPLKNLTTEKLWDIVEPK